MLELPAGRVPWMGNRRVSFHFFFGGEGGVITTHVWGDSLYIYIYVFTVYIYIYYI